jgi:hypothetical protein
LQIKLTLTDAGSQSRRLQRLLLQASHLPEANWLPCIIKA